MNITELKESEKKYAALQSKADDIQMFLIELLSKTHEDIKDIESQPDIKDREYLRITIGDNDFMNSIAEAIGKLIRDIIQSNSKLNFANIDYISYLINHIWLYTYKLDKYINKHDILNDDDEIENHLKPTISIVSYDTMMSEEWENKEVMYIPINSDSDIIIK